MTIEVETRAIRYATRVGWVGVAVGLAITAPLWGAMSMDMPRRAPLYAISLFVLVARSLPALARGSARAILRRQGRGGAWTGALGGLACLVAAAAGIALANLLLEVPRSARTYGLHEALGDYVGKPLLLLLLFGCVPALLVGLVCGWAMRKRIARMLCVPSLPES